MQQHGGHATVLAGLGLKNLGNIYWNLSTASLYEETVRRREGWISHLGPLVVHTGHHTGRSPNDKFIVREPATQEHINWGKVNQPLDEGKFDALYAKMCAASLSKTEVSKMADVAHDGLARAIRPAHSMFDGDTIFGLATGEHDIGDLPAAMRSTPSRQSALNLILRAAAEVFADACGHAVLAATTLGDAPAYAALCASARRLPRRRPTSAQ